MKICWVFFNLVWYQTEYLWALESWLCKWSDLRTSIWVCEKSLQVLQNDLWSKQIKKELIDLSLFGKSSMNNSSLAFFRSKRWLQWLCVRVPGYADCCIYLDEAASALVCGGKTRLGGWCSAAKPLISALNHFRGQSSTDSLRQ